MKPYRSPLFTTSFRLCFTAAAVASTILGHAATFTWDGDGPDAATATATNWVGDIAPGTGQDLVLSGTSPIGTTLNWNLTNGNNPRSVVFDPTALGYTISGNQIQMTQGTTVLANNSSNPQTVSNSIHVFYNSTKTINANTANLTLGALGFRSDGMAVTTPTAQNNQLTLTGSANGSATGVSEINSFTAGINRTLNKTGAGNWTITGAMTGGYTVNSNAGVLTLGPTGTSTYSGTTNVNGGSIVVQKNTGLGATSGGTTVAAGTNQGTLRFDSTSTNLSVPENISLGMRASVTANNAITMSPQINNLGGTTTITGNINSGTGGAVSKVASDAGTLIFAGTFNAQGASPTASTRISTLQGTASGVISGPITQSANIVHVIDKFGTGTWSFTNNANSFSGGARIVEGVLAVSSIADGGVASALGMAANTANFIQINGGTLQYTGAGNSTDRLFTIGANGATIDSSGAGAINFTNTGSHSTANGGGTGIQYSFANGSNTIATNDSTSMRVGMTVGGVAGLPVDGVITAINHSGGTLTLDQPTTAAAAVTSTGTASGNFDRTLTLTGANAGDNKIAGALADASGGGKLSVLKDGIGTWELSGTGTYTGGTTVNAGTLVLSGSSPGAGAFTVNDGAILAGEGTIGGYASLGVTTGTAFLANGGTIGNLSVSGTIDLVAPVNVAITNATAGGTYNIIGYSEINGASNFISTYHRDPVFNIGTTLATLTISGGISLTWAGNNGSNWDSGTTVNWSGGEKFFSLDNVEFNDSGSTTAVTLVGDLRPASVTVNSNTNSYVFGGPGSINGPTALVKSGSSTLALATTNGFTGGTTINGGVIEFSSLGSFGAGNISINGGGLRWASGNTVDVSGKFTPLGASGATLDLNGNNVTLASSISGSGGITKTGLGNLSLTAANAFSGPVSFADGTLFVSTSSSLGDDLAGTSIQSGAQLNLSNLPANTTFTEELTLSGLGDTSGALRIGSGKAVTIASPVTLAGNAMFKADGTSSFAFTGGITGTNTSATFVLDGTGTATTVAGDISLGTGGLTRSGGAGLILTGNNNYGDTLISSGTLVIGNQTATGNPGTGPITNNGALHLNRSDSGLTLNKVISGSGSLVVGTTTGGNFGAIVTLTGSNTFSGNIDIRSGSIRIKNSNALGTGPKTVTMSNGTTGRPGIRLDGSAGNITVPAAISFTSSSADATNPAIRNEAGNNTIEGNWNLTSGGGSTRITVDAGTLTLSGAIAPSQSGRFLILDGVSDGTSSGIIRNDQVTPANILAVQKEGAGKWTFSGTNTYTGTTAVNGGTLLINGDHTAATGAITVNGTAILGGSGTLGGAVSVTENAKLAPGTTAGTLTTSANVSGSGTLALELDGASADQLALTGTGVLYISTLKLDVATLAGGATLPVYVIVNSASAITGTAFASVTGIPSGYTLTYNYNDGVDSNNIALVSGTASPFASWTASNGLVGGDAAPGADPDADGLSNLIEFIVGGQPNPANPNASSSALVPTQEIIGSNLVFTYRRADLSTTEAGLVITAEFGTNLSAWTTAVNGVGGVTITETPDGFGSGIDKVEVSIPMGTETELFARLKAVLP